jgi:hypothetical protein
MPGLVPGIHVFSAELPKNKTWMAGTSPAMTKRAGAMDKKLEVGL